MIPAYIFIDKTLCFFGASIDIYQYARDYVVTILIRFISFSFAIMTNNLIRAEGKPKGPINSIMNKIC